VHNFAGIFRATKFRVSARASRLNSSIAPRHNRPDMLHLSSGIKDSQKPMRSAAEERFNRTDQSFFMKWDTLERRAKFSTEKIGPFSWKQRQELSQTMTVRQVLDTVEYKVRPLYQSLFIPS
jgi:hypothetical protein